jgi:hypothetical protein
MTRDTHCIFAITSSDQYSPIKDTSLKLFHSYGEIDLPKVVPRAQ